MTIYVVDVRDKKTPGRRRFNVSRRAHHRDDMHARNFGNPFGTKYELSDYTKWAVATYQDALTRLGQTGAAADIELACWCHCKPRCHAHLVKRLAEELAARTPA